MGEAIGQLLPFAVGVAISPTPIVAMILMLITPKARMNGFVFVLGWIVGIVVAGAVFLALASPTGASDEGAPARWTYWLKLVLGLLLLLGAVKEWRARPAPGVDAAMPKWMGMLDGMSTAKAGGLAFVLSALNPKNLIFIIGGAAVVAQAGLSTGDQVVAWIVFTLIATIGVAAPLVIYLAMGSRAASILDGLKTWMAQNNTAVMAVLCLIIGVKLVGDAISGLSA
jgi:threonine/homoserine/homoserine lactone efflux protein